MAFNSLSHFISALKDHDELITINEFVDPVLEISEITDRFSKIPGGGKALLFNDTGTDFPVLSNSMGSLQRIALALGVKKLEDITGRLESLFEDLREPRKGFMDKLAVLPKLARISGFFPSDYRGKAPVQEIIHKDPDLDLLPVLKTWPYDGGRFFTFPMVITHDPETGERNVGMYRMQVFNKNTTGMHWHRHKTGANHYEKYKKAGLRMPVAVALGGDPVLTYSATAPLPENIDEYLFAGFLRQKSVSLVKALTQDIMVPAESDIVIEGYVNPAEEKVTEGPFGDHTGFYSLEDLYPLFHVTAITHRKSAVFPATLVGIPPQEDAKIAKATETIFFMPIRQAIVPELTSMKIPDFGVAHNLTLVNISKSYPGQAKKVMNALWGAGQMMFNKILVVADEGKDLEDPRVIIKSLKNLDPTHDFVFSSGPLDVLDHSSDNMGFGGKLGLDLTKKFPEEENMKAYYLQIIKENPEDDRTDIIARRNLASEDGEDLLCLINIRKTSGYNRNTFLSRLLNDKDIKSYPYCLFTDDPVNIKNIQEFLWYLLNNIEVNRDIIITRNGDDNYRVFIDGTSKISKAENFPRDWPNAVTMNEETIQEIDKRWNTLQLGDFIPSPSRDYNRLIVTPGARAHKRN